jgi:hypothetical protein
MVIRNQQISEHWQEELLAKSVVSVPEAGSLLGLGRSASYEAARRGEIPIVSIGRKLVVPTAPLRRLLGVNTCGPSHGQSLADAVRGYVAATQSG